MFLINYFFSSYLKTNTIFDFTFIFSLKYYYKNIFLKALIHYYKLLNKLQLFTSYNDLKFFDQSFCIREKYSLSVTTDLFHNGHRYINFSLKKCISFWSTLNYFLEKKKRKYQQKESNFFNNSFKLNSKCITLKRRDRSFWPRKYTFKIF